MDSPEPLVCAGRPVDDAGQPLGEVCGRTFGGVAVGDGNGWMRWPTPAEMADQARAAGWSPTGPMCRACRKPSPEMTQLAKELRRG